MMHKKPPPGKHSAVAISENSRLFNTTPPFHAAGIGTMTFFAIWLGCCSILPPQSHKPLDAATVASALHHANASSMLVVPSILEEMSKDPELSDVLRRVPNVIFSGGTLSKEAGDKLKDKTHLTSYIGATEFAIFPHLMVEESEDWEYSAIDPCYNVEFCLHVDNMYEAVIVRSKDCEMYQPVWSIFPDLHEYHTRDLYSKHPSKSGLWKHCGRMDDIVVFVNGEKLNPITIEDQVGRHRFVKSALVVGEGRFHAALLVEPTIALDTTAERARLLDEIWPVIEKANDASPTHGRLSKAHILFTRPEKPILRAGKGTVQRRLTLTAYADEINALYNDAERIMNGGLTSQVHGFETTSLEPLILRLVQGLALHKKCIGPDDDFFSHGGMDSLQVLELVRQLGVHGYSTRDTYGALSPSTVYNNPTASSLARAIQNLRTVTQERKASSSRAKTKEMRDLLFRFSGPKNEEPSGRPDVIILTGSTGALGPYLLNSLLEAPNVDKVYCLGRAVSRERQVEINASRDLYTNLENSRVEFLIADLTAPYFRLDKAIFQNLSTTVTRIVHCAWPVNFNLSLQSFSPQLQGVRALMDFAALPRHRKSILFISSIASVGNWSAPEPVPEIALWDSSLPSPTGYAESKFLAEQLLLGSASLIDVSICRVGQVTGPVLSDKGVWKKGEWLPSLIKSSEYLQLLPESLGSSMTELDWIPVDLLSAALVELALLSREDSSRVYHAVSPRTCDWKTLLPTVRDLLGAEKVRIVPFGDWVDALRKSARETFEKQNFDKNPAIKLLDFFEGLPAAQMPRLSTAETQKRSRVLREMRAVDAEDMKRWMRQWGFGLSDRS